MNVSETERIVMHIPVDLPVEEFAKLCRVRPDTSAYETVEEAYPLIKEFGAPKAILRWADIQEVTEDTAVINGVTFQSRIVAEKMKGLQRVFVSVATAGSGLEQCEDLADDVFLDSYNGALRYLASLALIRCMKEDFGFDGTSMLNPGSLPDWPIENNFGLFDIIGNVEEIGVSLNEAGYIKPWNSGSGIHFPGNGYQNCSLCKKYTCIGRRAKFDPDEYRRIFKTEP